MKNENVITVFGRTGSAAEDELRGSLGEKLAELRYGIGAVSVEELKARLSSFLLTMNHVLHDLPAKMGDFSLETMTLSLEISANGKVNLIGASGEIAGKGGLTFTLKRATANPGQ
jgi:hypothetical protein